jgi:hypothetical protein
VSRGEILDDPFDALFEVAARDRRPHRRGEHRGREHFVERADASSYFASELEYVGARMGVDARRRNRRAEGRERPRPVSDGIAHHLGDFTREGPLALLYALMCEDVILEHEVVRDRDRHDHEVVALCLQRRVQQACFRRLQLAAVAASAFRIEEQIVLLQDLGDVGLQRDQVRGVLRVPSDRDRAGDVPVEQAQRTAEQVDAGRDERRPNPVVVQRERLHEVIDMALVIRRVHNPVRLGRGYDVVEVFGPAFDFPKNWVKRMLQCAVETVALGRPQLLQVLVHALARVFEDVLARKHCLGDVVQHRRTECNSQLGWSQDASRVVARR